MSADDARMLAHAIEFAARDESHPEHEKCKRTQNLAKHLLDNDLPATKHVVDCIIALAAIALPKVCAGPVSSWFAVIEGRVTLPPTTARIAGMLDALKYPVDDDTLTAMADLILLYMAKQESA